VRLGVSGAKNDLGFDYAFNGKDFLKSGINFSSFDKVFFKEISEDNGETSQRDLLLDQAYRFVQVPNWI
jgi:Xaa-Pro aminopeptidase